MTFLSYAQNFEDVMLWRALRHVEHGFYIDVGAAHPDVDSVTRAFYDRGWRGLNIEPVPASALRLRDARPRDVTLQIALGAEAGTAELFVVEGTGLSTLETSALGAIGAAGFGVQTQSVEVSTLAAICREHATGIVHFLKIDVEGSELSVLRGADFTIFRPWIVVVEATAPMSTQELHGAWEPILLSAAYRFVYFDGLNRFYVCYERYDALAPSFRTPPNVFDDFVRVAESETARRLVDAQAQAAAFVARAGEADRATEIAAARSAENTRLQEAIILLQAEFLTLQHQASEASTWLQATRSSTSWRVTAPLRAGLALGKAMIGHLSSRHRASPPAGLAAGDAVAPVLPASVPQEAVPPEIHPSLAIQRFEPVRRHEAGPNALRHAVHQFHSGSAVGDAITNAMLLTRSLLRREGYVSDIFVEHLDPALADELRPIDELPEHAEYVLIVRHSMGFDAFARVASLPAPKILIYHNITPPDFLTDAPALQEYARLGAAQLARLRPLVQTALADSEFNAIDLRRLGFEGVQTCMLLFDVAALRARAAEGTCVRRDDIFTILFVGRVIRSKGQDDLVAAYARFREVFEAPSRLVIVGRHDGPGSAYFDAIQARIADEGIAEHVTLTGLVSDAELHEWYSAADLYVSVSRHEGFGVPLVEAMAHGVPVLARPSGAVPYTLGGMGQLLSDATPSGVAAAMLALARDPERRIALGERGRQSLDRFKLDRQFRTLAHALAQAGAAAPEDRSARALLDANIRFTVTGHVNKTYSLAAINRTLALTIEGQRPGSVRIVPVESAPTTDLSEVPQDLRAGIAALAAREAPQTGPELVISQHYPVYVPHARGDVCLAMFFWEESRIPAETVALLNEAFRGVLSPSHAVSKALIDSGVSIPVFTLGFAPELSALQMLVPRPAGEGSKFSFLHISSGFPRKGIDVLLAAYARAFRADDPVRLVVKVFPNPHNDIAAQIERLKALRPDLAEIVLIDRDVSASELQQLYAVADTVVLPTRGEGFNLPAAEAMAAGVPLVVTGSGGHMDFCSSETARLLDFRFAPSGTHLATPHSVWAEPDEDDLVAALHQAVADREANARRAQVARGAVATLLDGTPFMRRLADFGLSLLLQPHAAALRIGWVSTWQVRCGVAGYSRNLLEAMPDDTDITVFCDDRTDADATAPDGMTIRRTWRLGDPASIPSLATSIAALDPHVLVIQHQPGLFAWQALTALLGTRAALGRCAVVVLHNTRHLLEIDDDERSAALRALSNVARVVVHTVADLNFLKGLGLVRPVTMIPHGAPRPLPPRAIEDIAMPSEPIVACYGFFLSGKGIGELIEAAAILRQQGREIRLRLVNADYGTADSAHEIARCRAMAEASGVVVEWHTEFLANEASLELLRECDVVALPYQASKEASSAALRTALSAGAPVAVTPLALFDEAADAVFRLPGPAPGDIAAGLAILLADAAMRRHLQQSAAGWLAERAWPDVAARLLGMLTGLVRSG